MEREQRTQRPASPGAGGPGPERDEIEQIRAEAKGILEAADRVLDSIRPVNAEDYLQQNRQRGGE